MNRDRYIARPADWWEIVKISSEGRRTVVGTAPTQELAEAEAKRLSTAEPQAPDAIVSGRPNTRR